MDSKNKNLAVAGATLLGLIGAADVAQAQDFGIGGGVTLASPIGVAPLPGPLAGLEAVYWFDDNLALDIIGNLGVIVPDGADARFDLGLGAGILYAVAQGDDTKLELGARAGVIAVINSQFGVPPGVEDEDADLFLDVLLRVEHWFDSHFAMNAQVGVNFRGDPDGNPGFGMFVGAQVGINAMYYIDGNARPGDGETAPEPEPVRETYTPPPPARAPDPPPPAEEPPNPESGAAGW